MGANDVLLRALLRPGDHVVIPHDAYGGTFRLVDKVLAPWGVEHTPVDLADVDALRAALRPDDPGRSGARRRPTRCWASPTSPRVADVAREAGARLVVDNTFASPYLQPPLALGADVVAALHHQVPRRPLRRRRRRARHLRRRARRAAARSRRTRVGAVPGPFDAWLTLRGRQDPRGAHGAAQRQRRAGRRAARRAPRGRAGALPGPARAPGPRGRGQADAPVRRDGVVPPGRRAARRRCGSARPPRCSRSPSRSAASSR